MVTSTTVDRNYDYIKLKNIDTGEEIIVDKRLMRYKRMAMGFLNKLRLDRKFVKHITLTQVKECYKPRILKNFLNMMKRRYKNSVNIWAVEVQEERLKKYGDHVLHWHLIFAFDWDIDFGKDDVLRIQKYWKYGQVEITPVRKPSVGYLMKYITKALDADPEIMRGIRRMGCSLISGWLRQSWNRVVEAIDFFLSVNYLHIDDFTWRNGKAYVDDPDRHGSICIYRPRKRWRLEGMMNIQDVHNLF